MSARTNDGGFAFPRPPTEESYGQEGMTLRDYLAAKAMNGLLSTSIQIDNETFDCTRHARAVAEAAYVLADAMLAERDK